MKNTTTRAGRAAKDACAGGSGRPAAGSTTIGMPSTSTGGMRTLSAYHFFGVW
jgi:hypothetical protein